jgi:hypothetical protein
MNVRVREKKKGVDNVIIILDKLDIVFFYTATYFSINLVCRSVVFRSSVGINRFDVF